MSAPWTNSTNQQATYSNPGDPGPAEHRKLSRGRKDFTEDAVPILQHGPCRRHTVLCLWCQSKQTCRKTRRASSEFAPRRLCSHPGSHDAGDTPSKPESQHIRTEASTAAVEQGQGPLPKAVTKGGKLGHTKESNKYAQLRRDETWSQFTAQVSVTKDVHEHIAMSGIMLSSFKPKADPEYQRTEAEIEALLGGWRIANVEQSGRAAGVEQSPEYSVAS